MFDPAETMEEDEGGTQDLMVKYTITCRDFELQRSQQYCSNANPFQGKELQPLKRSDSTVLEVFVEVSGLGGSLEWTPNPTLRRDDDEFDQPRPAVPAPVRSNTKMYSSEELSEALESFQASSVKIIAVHILSPRLQECLRSLTSNYPIPALNANPIIIDHPLKILVQNFEVLENLAAKRRDEADDRDISKPSGSLPLDTASPDPNPMALIVCDEATRHDLNILLDFVKPIYFGTIEPSKKRQDAGLVTYDMLWLLFVRGSYVYTNVTGKLKAFILDNGEYTRSRGRTPGLAFVVSCWCWDTSRPPLVNVGKGEFEIRPFKGERDIESLPVFPAKFYDAKYPNARRDLESRGKIYYEYFLQMPMHMKYSGPAWKVNQGETDQKNPRPRSTKPDSQYEGEVVLDRSSYLEQFNSPLWGPPDTGTVIEPEEEYRDYPPILVPFDPSKRPTLKTHECLFFSRAVSGYALQSKVWMEFDVEYASKIEWKSSAEDIMSRVILPPRDVEIIQALSQPFQKGQPDLWGADFIAGKGESQVFLLHGPPGTGKTYTVECVAESTRTPLLALTVADIGTDEQAMERKLSRWLQLATNWNAIILIDEADVFLEKRRVEADALRRNSLVSVFLRCLEYYKGVIFLTTNRVGHIDDAFLSRTSMAVTYPTLNIEAQRRIWENFIKKLRKERTDIVITPRAIRYVTESKEMECIPWNGREIRNALQTAIALARHQNQTAALPSPRIEVDEEHFYRVLDRKKKFLEYRDRISNMDEQKRAYIEKSRAPVVVDTPKPL